MQVPRPFDGFVEYAKRVSPACLVHLERNRYSVPASFANRPVSVRVYPERIIVVAEGQIICEHRRVFARSHHQATSATVYDWRHYLAVIQRKPGALRNGAPFQGWELPPALARLRRKLGVGDDADRRFVRVLAAVLDDGLEAVEAAVREALLAGVASDDVIVNILARRREPPRPLTIITPEDLALRHPPRADCNRYDSLRGLHAAA